MAVTAIKVINQTGRGRPGSRSFLAIVEALERSPSKLMREAEIYRARISGEEVEPQRLAPGGLPESEIQARMARMSEAAPSPAARRWFHAVLERPLFVQEDETGMAAGP